MPQIPPLAESDLQSQLISWFPEGWASSDARSTGLLADLYKAFAGGFADQLGANPTLPGKPTIQFAHDLTRIATATGAGLDTIAQDYFGFYLFRLAGESDSSFRARILYAIVQPRVTRDAIAAAILNLTTFAPRMIEPWNPMDTCAWDANSYWDCDDQTYPARWGDPGAKYQGFIIAQEPLYSITGGEAVPCWDAQCFFDTAGSYWLDQSTAQGLTNVGALVDLLLAFKAFGTQPWLAVIPPLTTITSGYAGLSLGQDQLIITRNSQRFPYMKGFMPILAIENPSWLANAWIPDCLQNPPVVNFDSPAPAPSPLGWIALSPGFGFIRVAVAEGTTQITIPEGVLAESGDDIFPFFFPNWNTTKSTWGPGSGPSTQAKLQFGTPAPAGAYVDICTFQNFFFPIVTPGWIFGATIFSPGQPQLPSGAVSYTIDHGLNLPYKVFGQTSWLTQVQVTKTNGRTVFTFSTPAPPGSPHSPGSLWWVIQEG